MRLPFETHDALKFADPAALALATGVLCFALAAWLGSWFPDIDRIKFLRLRHRSMVTHSFFLPALSLIGRGLARGEWADWLAAGFSAGVALHLAFDLFPEKWRGFALIDAPKFGRRSKTASVVWLFTSAFLCAGFSMSIMPALGAAGPVVYVATLAALYLYGVWVKKERFAAGPLLALLTLGGDAFWTMDATVDATMDASGR